MSARSAMSARTTSNTINHWKSRDRRNRPGEGCKGVQKDPKPVKELSPETERTNSYQHYVMSGKGDTPEQKVNEAVKELNYHNMLVVVAVRDKTINNIGSIHTVAKKWGLSYSIIQRAISGIKEHHQGGRQHDKIARHLQRRSRCKQDEPQALIEP